MISWKPEENMLIYMQNKLAFISCSETENFIKFMCLKYYDMFSFFIINFNMYLLFLSYEKLGNYNIFSK